MLGLDCDREGEIVGFEVRQAEGWAEGTVKDHVAVADAVAGLQKGGGEHHFNVRQA